MRSYTTEELIEIIHLANEKWITDLAQVGIKSESMPYVSIGMVDTILEAAQELDEAHKEAGQEEK